MHVEELKKMILANAEGLQEDELQITRLERYLDKYVPIRVQQ
jgi:hypothetical protein